MNQYKFQVSLNESCNASLEDDTLTSLRSLNQSRRRAVRVEPTWRCSTCARPLFMPPPPRIQKLGLAMNLSPPSTTSLYNDNMSVTNVSVTTHHTHQASSVHGLREGGGGSTTSTHPSFSPSSTGAAAMAGESI